MCGKGPVPFPACLPAGCSPQPVARLVAVPEGGEGGAVPGTPRQAGPSSPPRHSAPHGGGEASFSIPESGPLCLL